MREFCLNMVNELIKTGQADPFVLGNKIIEWYEAGYITEVDLKELQDRVFTCCPMETE